MHKVRELDPLLNHGLAFSNVNTEISPGVQLRPWRLYKYGMHAYIHTYIHTNIHMIYVYKKWAPHPQLVKLIQAGTTICTIRYELLLTAL